MTHSRKIGISLRIEPYLMQKIDELSESEFKGNTTNAIVSLMNEGFELRNARNEIKENPEKLNEVIEKMEEMRKNEKVLGWLDTQPERVKNAIVDHVMLNKK